MWAGTFTSYHIRSLLSKIGFSTEAQRTQREGFLSVERYRERNISPLHRRHVLPKRGLWRIGISRFSIKSILLGDLCVSNESYFLQDEWPVKIHRLFHAPGHKWMQVSSFTPLTFPCEGGYDYSCENRTDRSSG